MALAKLELEDKLQLEKDLEAIHSCWGDLMNAVNKLLAALP
jgi:hypothetical protein